jgi:hypothetical protein
MAIDKIDFYVRTRMGGGFIARAYNPALEAEGDRLGDLRDAIKRVVRARFGENRPVALFVGELRTIPEIERRRPPSTSGVTPLRSVP